MSYTQIPFITFTPYFKDTLLSIRIDQITSFEETETPGKSIVYTQIGIFNVKENHDYFINTLGVLLLKASIEKHLATLDQGSACVS